MGGRGSKSASGKQGASKSLKAWAQSGKGLNALRVASTKGAFSKEAFQNGNDSRNQLIDAINTYNRGVAQLDEASAIKSLSDDGKTITYADGTKRKVDDALLNALDTATGYKLGKAVNENNNKKTFYSEKGFWERNKLMNQRDKVGEKMRKAKTTKTYVKYMKEYEKLSHKIAVSKRDEYEGKIIK